MEQYNDWLSLQLLCYCGYVIVCLVLIWLESDENTQLAISCKLNAVYDPARSSKRRSRITQLVIFIAMVILSIVFVLTLKNNNFDEAFMVFASTGLQVAGHPMRKLNWDGIDDEVQLYLSSDRADSGVFDAGLPFFTLPHRTKFVGSACSAQLPPSTAVLLIYKDSISAENFGFATFQGIFFLGGLISLYWAQSRKYDFINLDQYLRTLSAQHRADGEHKDAHEDGKESVRDSLEDCPYAAFLRNIHEKPRRIGCKEFSALGFRKEDAMKWLRKPTCRDAGAQATADFNAIMRCGVVLTSFKRVAHVTLNIWRNWQFILSTLLVTFSQIDLAYRVYRDLKTDFVAASTNCTESCSNVCSLPANVFESTPEGAVEGFEKWLVPDGTTWKPIERQLPDGTMGSGASWHSRDVWWANPNAAAPLYCQWGWGEHFWDEAFLFPYVGIFDYTCESPTARIWMNKRGKFYGRGKNVTADRIQNWLTNDLDTVVPASHAGPWIIRRYIWSTVLAVSGLIASTIVFRTLAACRRRYGTLGYLLTLEAQKSNRLAHFRRLIYVACFSVIMITTVPIVWNNYWHMEGFHTAGYVVQTCLAIFQIMAGLYSLLTEATLVNRRMLDRMDGSLELPMMKWYTPTQTTLAQAFLVALLPEAVLLRDKSSFAHASDHVDTTFLRVLSTEELLRVRSFWCVEDEQRTGGVAEPERSSPPPTHISPSGEHEAPVTTHTGRTPLTRRASSLSHTQHHTTLRIRSQQCADRCWRYLHIACSLREHWLIWVGWLSRMPPLLSLALRVLRHQPPTFIDCRCICGGTTIKDCFDRVMAQHVSTEAISASIFAACIAVSVVTICLKIRLDLDQVRGCEYGTFEYILRLELRKRSFKNRVLIIFTVGFTTLMTSIFVVIYLAGEFSAQGFINIAAVLAEILQTWIAGFILYTEVGFLTPNSVTGAPYVRVPMAFYQPSEWVLARLMKLAMLTDEEILGLPHNLHTVKGIDVRPSFIRSIAPKDLLAIKRSLRAEYTGLFTHQSRGAPGRKSVIGLLARFNASSSSWGARAMNRSLRNTSRVACDPEASSNVGDRCCAKEGSDRIVAKAAGETPAAESDC